MIPATDSVGYGSFQIGPLNLALPIAAIREVQPLEALTALPCKAPGLLGGLGLRGLLVPVIDLSTFLGLTLDTLHRESVLVVAAKGRLLGLAVSQVKELFYLQAVDMQKVHIIDESNPIFTGSVTCPQSGSLLNTLCPDALVSLTGIPTVYDSEREQLAGQDASQSASLRKLERGKLFMVLKSGDARFVIDPTCVESTLANPELVTTKTCAGYFEGEILYRGQYIASVNLNRMCGLKTSSGPGQLTEAFVVRMSKGAVAFLIEHVVDMVSVDPDCVVPLGVTGSSEINLINGVMPNAALGADFADKHHCGGMTHFVLSPELIQTHDELVNLASLCAQRKVESSDDKWGSALSSGEGLQGERLITFTVVDEYAARIDSVVKVLSYNPELELLPGDGALLGYVYDQGENIQVYSLSHLMTGKRQSLGVHSSILIVQCASAKLGFAVRSLKTIESARWKNSIPVLGEQRLQPGSFGQTSHLHVELGTGHDKRMLRVLDLVAIADSVTGPSKQADADSLDVLDLLPELLDQHL